MSLESMKRRLEYQGGAQQQDRMISDRLRSMLSATKYSYQAARFTKYKTDKSFKGLFNPVSQTENYDTKMISIPFDSEYKVGTIFEWENTKTDWIIFLQDKTELAYFRGECRRCDYVVKWVNSDREQVETLLSVIGPSVNQIRSSSSMGAKISQDFPNANLKMMTQDNEQNRGYFHQYQEFLLDGTTWKIHEIDRLSMPGIIQISAIEHYTNLIEDDVENNVANTWNVQPIMREFPTDFGIEGDNVIKPKFEYRFNAIAAGGRWFIIENEGQPAHKWYPVELTTDVFQQTIVLKWNSMKSGQFTLAYKVGETLYQRHIVVESLM